MESFSKTTYHVRSVSLPSTPNPRTCSVEVQLDRLRSISQASSSTFPKLSGLKELYECLDDLLQLPLTQQALSNGQDSIPVNQVLDTSLWLLDVCCSTIDIFSQMKECLKELESSLRRKRGNSNLASEFDAYMNSRKKLKQVICNSFRNLKNINSTSSSSSTLYDKDPISVFGKCREVEEVSVEVFESLLSFFSQNMAKSRLSGWSVVSRLVKTKRLPHKRVIDANEMGKMDAELLALKSNKDNSDVQVQNVIKGLEALESNIQEVEEELECVYRRLLKTRVSLLNIFNH